MSPQQDGNNVYQDPLASPSSEEEEEQYNKSTEYNTMENLDPHEPVERLSVYKRESFLVEFVKKPAPRQILILVLLLALGFGSTVGIVPAVMTDRYARLNHGYADPRSCADWSMKDKPHECLAGSGDAQNGAAYENLLSNMLTFITSSLVGSISDEKGRRGTFALLLSL